MALPSVSFPAAVGRKFVRIYRYENNLREEDYRATAVAPIGGGDRCTRCTA